MSHDMSSTANGASSLFWSWSRFRKLHCNINFHGQRYKKTQQSSLPGRNSSLVNSNITDGLILT